MIDRDATITAYFKHAELGMESKEYFWAFDAVGNYVSSQSAESGWDLVIELVRRAPDSLLGKVAVGPLEDLICLHGAALIEWIEGEARRDPRFRYALGRIWMTRGRLPSAVEDRIVAASGRVIQLLDERDVKENLP